MGVYERSRSLTDNGYQWLRIPDLKAESGSETEGEGTKRAGVRRISIDRNWM